MIEALREAREQKKQDLNIARRELEHLHELDHEHGKTRDVCGNEHNFWADLVHFHFVRSEISMSVTAEVSGKT